MIRLYLTSILQRLQLTPSQAANLGDAASLLTTVKADPVTEHVGLAPNQIEPSAAPRVAQEETQRREPCRCETQRMSRFSDAEDLREAMYKGEHGKLYH